MPTSGFVIRNLATTLTPVKIIQLIKKSRFWSHDQACIPSSRISTVPSLKNKNTKEP